MEVVNACLDWLRQNKEVLGWLGSGLTVVTGGIWTIWKHTSEKRKPSLTLAAGPTPIVKVSIEHGNSSQPPRKLLIREGQNNLESIPVGERIITIVFSGFLFVFLMVIVAALRMFVFTEWQLLPFSLFSARSLDISFG